MRPVSDGARRAVQRFRRGGAILPCTFTILNLLCGFWSIVQTFEGRFHEAALLIFGSVVFDVLDGRIARLTGTTSEFGGELDSLSDVIAFGVAPALLAYSWGLAPVPGRIGGLAAFLFVACGALRLARFNVQKHAVDGRYFVGMPIPAAAGQVAAIVHFSPDRMLHLVEALPVVALVVILAFLMVSTFRYNSFKGVDLRSRRSYIDLLGVVLVLVVILTHPQYTLLFVTSLYSLSAPVGHLLGMLRRRPPTPAPQAAPGEAR